MTNGLFLTLERHVLLIKNAMNRSVLLQTRTGEASSKLEPRPIFHKTISSKQTDQFEAIFMWYSEY